MVLLQQLAQGLSFAVFAWYGTACFVSERMVAEFERYRLGRFRVLTGVLQVGAAVGLVAGHWVRPVLLASSGGLAVMMLLAVVTRVRIKDPWFLGVPAFTLFALNAFLFVAAW